VPATAKAGSVRSKYDFIKSHRKEFPTEVMCRVLGVAPSGYCEWLQRPQSKRAREDVRLLRLTRENGLRALHGYRTRRLVIGKPAVLIPNLLKRQFTATRPNVAWATGITCIRTRHGWLYLAVVLDRSHARSWDGLPARPFIWRWSSTP
jgi:putative transposase